jgi:hypothetical protein
MSRIKVTTTPRELEARIVFEIREQVDRKLRAAAGPIKKEIVIILEDELRRSETVRSLLLGSLRQDFGLYEGQAIDMIEKIVRILTENLDVSLNINPSSNLIFSISLRLNPNYIQDLSDVLRYRSKGGEVAWMEWLLTRGSEVVVDNFMQLNFSRVHPRSRAGYALMVPNGGRSFRVNPEFAGTTADNFITRIMTSAYPKFLDVIRRRL